MPFLPVNRSSSSGFTLVEVMVVVPIVVLVIAVIIGFLVDLTGNALMSRERTNLVYSTQDALNQIEQDVRVSTNFLRSTGALQAPQGSNSGYMGTAAFSSPANQLILEQYATTGSPYFNARELVYYADRPNACDDYHEYNEAVKLKLIYFIDNGDLTRRSVIDLTGPTCNVTSSDQIWQKNSCKITPDANSYSGRCVVRDAVLASNVNNFSLLYYNSPDSSTSINPTNISQYTSTVAASITQSKTVAGESINNTASVRASKINQQ